MVRGNLLATVAVLVGLGTVPVPASAQQSSGFRIVVIQGEDAVNIIQQKTAVAPIVEVRDRNGIPIVGVTVTFSIGGPGATFAGGASTLAVTTNAAGQAIVAGLTPTATGAVTINATAIVQGQTIAATIAQTNFATQAAAAAAAGTTSSAAGTPSAASAGSGGGGLSGGAIAGIAVGGAAALVGGVVLATGGEEPAVALPPPCTYSLGTTSQAAPDTGGSFSAALTTTCAWSVSSDTSFISITSATSGTGSATINYTVAANNLNRAPARAGRLTISGAGGTSTIEVSQDGGRAANVTITLSPNPVPFNGGPISFAPACAGIPNTWLYEMRFTESGGVAATLTRELDLFNGVVVNDVPRNDRIPANGTYTLTFGWCWTLTGPHSVVTTMSGADANGNSLSVTAPTATLLPPTTGTSGIGAMFLRLPPRGSGGPRPQ